MVKKEQVAQPETDYKLTMKEYGQILKQVTLL